MLRSLPVDPFYTVAEEPHQTLVSDMTNGLDLSSEFFLCLPTGKQSSWINIKHMIKMPSKQHAGSSKAFLQVVEEFLDCYLGAIDKPASVHNPITALTNHVLG